MYCIISFIIVRRVFVVLFISIFVPRLLSSCHAAAHPDWSLSVQEI